MPSSSNSVQLLLRGFYPPFLPIRLSKRNVALHSDLFLSPYFQLLAPWLLVLP